MNIPGDEAQQSMRYQPARNTFPIVPIILGLASLIGLLILLAIIASIKAFDAGKTDSLKAIAVGNSFIDNMGQHNYLAAQSLFTPELQAASPTSNLKDIEVLIEKYHGAFVTHGQPQWFRRESNGLVTVSLSYPAKFSQSGSQVTVRLLQTNKGYQIHDYRYEL